MKKVLIISPNFPPNNSADLHRVRQMLPYLQENNWSAHIVTVALEHIENLNLDPLLELSLPHNFSKTFVGSLPIKLTRKFGVGSLSMRTWFHYFFIVNSLLKKEKFDLIFFSTTAFHLFALGPIWKKLYKVPFIIDMQDPWRSDYYLLKPKLERPPKFRLNYLIDKYLENFTIPNSDGILSVSKQYIDTLVNRYDLKNVDFMVEPFSGVRKDFELLGQIQKDTVVSFENSKKNIVYIGRGGHDLAFAISTFFSAVKILPNELIENIRIWFIGTSYAPKGQGKKTVEHIAVQFGLDNIVTEITDRIPYFESLRLLKMADLLFVPGSNDLGYTASKIYPYILAEKPLITIFHESSSVNSILEYCNFGHRYTFGEEFLGQKAINKISDSIEYFFKNPNVRLDPENFRPFSDKEMTKRICQFFNAAIE